MMICENCGMPYEDCEVPTYEDDFGFETGVGWKSHKQKFISNCSCGGNIVNAIPCENCGEWIADTDSYICKSCEELDLEESEFSATEESSAAIDILCTDIFKEMTKDFMTEKENKL